MNNDFYENYHETTYEEDLAAQEKKHHSPIVNLILFLVKAWVLFHVAGILLVVVVFIGCYQAAKTGEENPVTKTIAQALEYAGEEVPDGKSLAEYLHENFAENENSFEADFKNQNSEESSSEDTSLKLPEREESNIGESSVQESTSEESTKSGQAEDGGNIWYLTLQVPEGSYFSITDNMNYVTHDIFDKRLVPLITDDRIKLAGIVEYEQDYMVAMVIADKEAFTVDGSFDEIAAQNAVYEQAEIVLREWYTIMGN